MAAFFKFNQFPQDLGLGVHNFSTHTLKAAFCSSAPVATNTILSNLTQLTAGGGYSAGGVTLSGVSWTNTAGVSKLVIADNLFTATGTTGSFRYVALYNSTAANGPLIGWYDYGLTISLNSGETFLIDFDATNGVLTLG